MQVFPYSKLVFHLTTFHTTPKYVTRNNINVDCIYLVRFYPKVGSGKPCSLTQLGALSLLYRYIYISLFCSLRDENFSTNHVLTYSFLARLCLHTFLYYQVVHLVPGQISEYNIE